MIASILPATVASAELHQDPDGVALFPDEQSIIAGAVRARWQTFASGRECARRALAELGVAAAPILRDGRGAPCWPPGIVGSITHCDGYRAAAVAWSKELTWLGIDAEPNDPLPTGVLRRIAAREERAAVADLSTSVPHVRWDRLLFSAKEAAYKASHPASGPWLDFSDATVVFDVSSGSFEARLAAPPMPRVIGQPHSYTGRWIVRDGLLATAIAVPVGGGERSL